MNKLKTILLALLAVGVSISAGAKEQGIESLSPEHEVKFMIGAFPILFNGWAKDGCGMIYPNFSNENYEQLLMFKESSVSAAYSLGYSYQVLKWLSVGATLSYVKESEDYYNRIDSKIIEESSISNFAIVPTISFTYLNRPMVRLYSQLGLGVRLRYHNSEIYSTKTPARVSGNITYFGVSVGKKFFGSMEFASGTQGVIVFGGGYRF